MIAFVLHHTGMKTVGFAFDQAPLMIDPTISDMAIARHPAS